VRVSFTGFDFLVFFLIVFALYWLPRWRHASGIPTPLRFGGHVAHGRHEAARLLRGPRLQNLLLLAASYLFYGWVHPWYALMLGASTLVDFFLAARMASRPENKRLLLGASLLLNLGVLAFFKYYNFFSPALAAALAGLGLDPDPLLVNVLLPAGLSFYTLKKMSYMFDVSNGALRPTHSLPVFALYVAFFPQLAAGPIDRPGKLIPQLEAPRPWNPLLFHRAWPLLVMGFFKKIVVADSLKIIVDQIFNLREPGGFVLLSASLGFTLQILADFSAYTDLARGIALLLGFETSENFNRPYLALTPSDFWNRWHITLSAWLRDYVFFPLRRALMRLKLPEPLTQAIPPVVTMFLCGLWHGAGWTFAAWGLYYGALIAAYQLLGLRGEWRPKSVPRTGLAWLVMFAFIVFGWLVFRAPSLGWVARALFFAPQIGALDERVVALFSLALITLYALPLLLKEILNRLTKEAPIVDSLYYSLATIATIIYIHPASYDFIYARF
jgi:D-alanyl-lipoteichoic acid acyltransferase DltB (MBOAT superfamily)